jgi:hypothetical protein
MLNRVLIERKHKGVRGRASAQWGLVDSTANELAENRFLNSRGAMLHYVK